MRILLSIPSLMPGGAERQFAELAAGLAARGHEVLAVALGQGGPLESVLGKAEFLALGKRNRWDNARVALRLAGLLRSFRPQVHYSFLTTPNVLGALLRPAFPGIPLVMGMRASAVDFSQYDYGLAGRLATRLEAWLSCLVQAIVINSWAGLGLCLERGFPKARCLVIPNGIDTDRFRPDKASGAALRASWGAPATNVLIGHVARLDPIKDHPTFLRAAALLAQRRPELRFVCIGPGPEDILARLKTLAKELGLDGRLFWAGGLEDMSVAYNALDLTCLCSLSEGFPNVLGEAMACGVPCVTTDAGDAALLVGETGAVAPRGDPKALAAALQGQLERLEREGEMLRTACRERILERFSVERMVGDTEALLVKLDRQGRP